MSNDCGRTVVRAILLGFSLLLPAGLVWAADDPDEWGGWGALPDEFLELTDSRDAAELSARLDQLIRDSGGSTQRDVILEAWLRQLTQQEGATSLDTLLDTWSGGEPPAAVEGERGQGSDADNRPGSAPDWAAGPDRGPERGADSGRNEGRGEGRPATPPGRDNSNRGRGNGPRTDGNAAGGESSR